MLWATYKKSTTIFLATGNADFILQNIISVRLLLRLSVTSYCLFLGTHCCVIFGGGGNVEGSCSGWAGWGRDNSRIGTGEYDVGGDEGRRGCVGHFGLDHSIVTAVSEEIFLVAGEVDLGNNFTGLSFEILICSLTRLSLASVSI